MALGGFKAPGGRARETASLKRVDNGGGSKNDAAKYLISDDPQHPVYLAGYDDGASEAKSRILGFLQQKYLGDNAPDRGSVEGNAILGLARELSEHLNREEAENPL